MCGEERRRDLSRPPKIFSLRGFLICVFFIAPTVQYRTNLGVFRSWSLSRCWSHPYSWLIRCCVGTDWSYSDILLYLSWAQSFCGQFLLDRGIQAGGMRSATCEIGLFPSLAVSSS